MLWPQSRFPDLSCLSRMLCPQRRNGPWIFLVMISMFQVSFCHFCSFLLPSTLSPGYSLCFNPILNLNTLPMMLFRWVLYQAHKLTQLAWAIVVESQTFSLWNERNLIPICVSISLLLQCEPLCWFSCRSFQQIINYMKPSSVWLEFTLTWCSAWKKAYA